MASFPGLVPGATWPRLGWPILPGKPKTLADPSSRFIRALMDNFLLFSFKSPAKLLVYGLESLQVEGRNVLLHQLPGPPVAAA